MALSTSIRSVKIDNNIINIGRGSNTGTITNYAYDGCMQLATDAIVTGNTIAGCIGGGNSSVNLLTVSDGSCVIRNNNFIRGAGSSVNSYINVSSSNDQMITGNVFDQITTNGSSSLQVQGLSSTSVCTANKNQVDYLAIPLSDFTNTGFLDNEDEEDLAENTDGTVTFQTNGRFDPNLVIGVGSIGSTEVNVGAAIPITNLIPTGAKLLEAKIGVVCFDLASSTIDTGAVNELEVRLKSIDRIANYQAGLNSILDPVANSGITTVVSSTLQFNTTTLFNTFKNGISQYLTTDISANAAFESKDKMLNAFVEFRMTLTAGIVQVYISPMVIKYVHG